MNTILAIALGGAAGALGRYGVSRLFTDLVHASIQPVATLAVNVIGCGIMGVCFGCWRVPFISVMPDAGSS